MTRNGAKSVVVMDCEAFENTMMDRELAKEEELRVYRGLMRGISDYVQGKTFSKAEFKRRIAAKSFEEE